MTAFATIAAAKARMALNSARDWRRHSRLKLALVSLAVVGLWLAVFVTFRTGLRWLDTTSAELLGSGQASLAELLLPRFLSLLALVLTLMLAVSSAILTFSALYRSREVAFLVGTPLGWRTLFATRFAETVVLASWSTAYVASPVVLAYGIARHAPVQVVLAAALLFLPFVTIPAALGSVLALVLARLVPSRPRAAVALASTGIVAAIIMLFRSRMSSTSFGEISNLTALLQLSGHAHNPYLPNTWLTAGVLAATRGDTVEVVFNLALLLSNAALLAWLAIEIGGWLFYPSWSRLAGASSRSRQRRDSRAGRLFGRLLPTRSSWWWLTVKDIRLFVRDPAQWGQLVVFFGVLAVYLASMDTNAGGYSLAFWQDFKTLLNTVACLLVVATLTTRLVFPLVSLEGKRFWILGLAPVTRRQIITQKLLLSIGATVSITGVLAVLSSWRLALAPLPVLVSTATVCAASVALSGIAVGLGSLYADFTQDDPARIVSGLGGTLTLIASLVYVILAATAETVLLRISREVPRLQVSMGVVGIVLVSVALAWAAARLGGNAFERTDL